jgi:hypothetical protein
MVQTAESGVREDCRSGRWFGFDRSALQSILFERIVNSIVVIIADVIPHQPPEMFFIQRDDVVQDLTAATSDPPFCSTVLSGRPKGGTLGLQARCPKKVYDPHQTSHRDRIWRNGTDPPRERLRAVAG